MRDEIANLVDPVFGYGLRLKERLERGEAPALETEQATLKGLVVREQQTRPWPEAGAAAAPAPVEEKDAPTPAGSEPDEIRGIRYALVCWLDEFFVLSSPWGPRWNERKLEGMLYGTNDRAWRFWQLAQRAETRPTTDALEVFYLCVLLGFRGELRTEPDKLREWLDATRARVSRVAEPKWPYPSVGLPPPRVPPLYNRARLQRLIVAGGIGLLVLLPVVAFLIVQRLGQ
jgi:type VI secretion system protein ImpK